jgi:hypothetical protein
MLHAWSLSVNDYITRLHRVQSAEGLVYICALSAISGAKSSRLRLQSATWGTSHRVKLLYHPSASHIEFVVDVVPLGQYSPSTIATQLVRRRSGLPRINYRQKKGIISVLHPFICSGANPTSYPMHTTGYSGRVKAPECQADHSPSSSSNIRNSGATSPLPSSCGTTLPRMVSVSEYFLEVLESLIPRGFMFAIVFRWNVKTFVS